MMTTGYARKWQVMHGVEGDTVNGLRQLSSAHDVPVWRETIWNTLWLHYGFGKQGLQYCVTVTKGSPTQ